MQIPTIHSEISSHTSDIWLCLLTRIFTVWQKYHVWRLCCLININCTVTYFWYGCCFAKASRSKSGNPDIWSQCLNVSLCLYCNWCKIVISSYFHFTVYRTLLGTVKGIFHSQLLLRRAMYLLYITNFCYFFPWNASSCPYKSFQRDV